MIRVESIVQVDRLLTDRHWEPYVTLWECRRTFELLWTKWPFKFALVPFRGLFSTCWSIPFDSIQAIPNRSVNWLPRLIWWQTVIDNHHLKPNFTVYLPQCWADPARVVWPVRRVCLWRECRCALCPDTILIASRQAPWWSGTKLILSISRRYHHRSITIEMKRENEKLTFPMNPVAPVMKILRFL